MSFDEWSNNNAFYFSAFLFTILCYSRCLWIIIIIHLLLVWIGYENLLLGDIGILGKGLLVCNVVNNDTHWKNLPFYPVQLPTGRSSYQLMPKTIAEARILAKLLDRVVQHAMSLQHHCPLVLAINYHAVIELTFNQSRV